MRYFAYGLIFTVLGLAVGSVLWSDRLPSLVAFSGGSAADALAGMTLALLAAWLVLVFQWMTASSHEFHLLRDTLEGVYVRSEAYVAIFLLAGSLGLMPILLLFDERWFTGYYVGFLAVNFWGQRITNRHVGRALGRPPKKGRARAARAIKGYWLGRPQLPRIAIMGGIACCGFLLALVADRAPGPTDGWHAASLGMVLATIVAGEVTMYIWRGRRDDEIAAD